MKISTIYKLAFFISLIALLLNFTWMLVFAAQPKPAGEQTLTSVVGSRWNGVAFSVDFDEAAIIADPTHSIEIDISVCRANCSESKNFVVVSRSRIKGGPGYSEKGDTTLNYPAPAGSTVRLSVRHNKDLVFNMRMGAKP